MTLGSGGYSGGKGKGVGRGILNPPPTHTRVSDDDICLYWMLEKQRGEQTMAIRGEKKRFRKTKRKSRARSLVRSDRARAGAAVM